MEFNFEGKVVLVTGATRGIGKQIADDFESLGAGLILTGTKKDQIDLLNREAALHKTGQKKRYFCVDFKDQKATEEFIDQLENNYKKIDVCVNNAGINKINYIYETELQDFNEILSVNLTAPFMITRKVSKIMKSNGYGRIVNISSIFGVISRGKRSIYSITKFGLRGLTLAASNELARHNILVNAVSPGFVLTELTKGILSKKEIADLSKQIPVGRFARPEEISKVVLFLASDMNTYITGQNIIVDGGYVNT